MHYNSARAMASHTGITCAFTLFLLLSCDVLALDILAVVSVPLGSHYMSFRTLFHELAVRGHNVTVLNNFPDKNPPPNLTFIDLQCNRKNNLPSMQAYETSDETYRRWHNYLNHITFGSANVENDCVCLFTSEGAKGHLASGRRYDVIFVEQFMSDCGLAYAVVHYDAPIIGITSHVLLPFAYPRLGLPFDVGADAFYFSDSGPNPTFIQKVENAILNTIFNTVGRWLIHRKIYNSFDRHIPNHSLDIERDARDRMVMMFSNQHFSLTGARLLPPQLIEIGGIHIGTPKPVPKDIEEFLSDATNGAIYVSFGTNLKISTISEMKLHEFLTAFKRLPYKIIWKYENATFSQKNLFTGNWFSQLDILCHPKVIGFVSHGGMLSLSEAAHCGTPLIAVPFFGDQFSNAAAAKASGIGKTMAFEKINADNLEKTIRELASPEMQESAQRVFRMWHDRPMPVLESAIYWTEYVARHKEAPPSLPTKYSTWFQSSNIDVAITIISILLLFGLTLYFVFKFIRLIFIRSMNIVRIVFLKKASVNKKVE